MLIYVEKKMPIWSKPSDKDYRGPAIYRLIVNEQNYCGKTFEFKSRLYNHKSKAKTWKERLAREGRAQDVHKLMDDNWDNVVIEIIARYPDKIKGVEADELFMDDREVEAIAFYDSFHNGLNMDRGGNATGNQRALGSTRTAEQKQAISQRMTGKKRGRAYNKPRSLAAKKGNESWTFSSTLQATQQLAIQFKENFDQSSISKACRGKFGSKKNLHTYKGIHFEYD
jgi:hypothetical protein